MSQAIIRKAFETRLDTWASAQSIDVAWENAEYDPSEGVAYVRAHLVPAQTKQLFLDQTGRKYSGLFQVNLTMPIGTGAGAAEALVESLDSTFAGSFEQDGVRITLLTPMSPAPALPVADRYVIPVSAEYRVVTV